MSQDRPTPQPTLSTPVLKLKPNEFSADRPIASRSEDRLGRWQFAEAIAQAICTWSGQDSLVIGICGPWGAGKTSVKNMVKEALQAETTSVPAIVDFSPWEILDRQQVASALFREIGRAMEEIADPEERAEVVRAWDRWILALGITDVGFSAMTGILAAQGIAKGSLFPQAIAALRSVFQVLKAGHAARKAAKDVLAKPLAELRRDLAAKLAKSSRLVVVFLDDLDRLAPDELRTMLQLVKASSDFPRLVFVLLFERAVATKSLSQALGIDGQAFLEKIVQVPFDLPMAPRDRVAGFVEERLDEIWKRSGFPTFQDEVVLDRWRRLWVRGLGDLFQTLRDAKRFLSTYSLQCSQLAPRMKPEVNGIDLAAIETIRLFEPALFERLATSKDLLLGRAFSRVFTELELPSKVEESKALIRRTSETHRQAVQNVLESLFPALPATITGQYTAVDDEIDQWHKELRVCHERTFDRFFLWALGPGDVSETEVDLLLESTKDAAKLEAMLISLGTEGRLSLAIQKVLLRIDAIAPEAYRPTITALFDAGDEVARSEKAEFPWASGLAMDALVELLCSRLGTLDAAETLLGDALRQSRGIVQPTIFWARSQRSDRNQGGTSHLVTTELPEVFRSICESRIRTAADNGALRVHGCLAWLLFRWRDLGGGEALRKWSTELVKQTEGALALLTSLCHQITTSGPLLGDEERRWKIDLDQVSQLTDLQSLADTTASLRPEELDEEKARVLRAFRKSLDARQRGIPE